MVGCRVWIDPAMISEPKNRIERERHMQFAGAMRGARRPSVGTKTLSSSDALGDATIEERSFVATLLRMTARAVWMLGIGRWVWHRQTMTGAAPRRWRCVDARGQRWQ